MKCNDFFHLLHNSAKSLTETTNIETYLQEKRRHKIKNMPGEEATDDLFATDESALLKKCFRYNTDTTHDKLTALQGVANNFTFSNGHTIKIMQKMCNRPSIEI